MSVIQNGSVGTGSQVFANPNTSYFAYAGSGNSNGGNGGNANYNNIIATNNIYANYANINEIISKVVAVNTLLFADTTNPNGTNIFVITSANGNLEIGPIFGTSFFNMNYNGGLTIPSLSVTGNTVLNNLTVTGTLTANLNIGTNFASLNVSGNTVSNNLVVNSNAQINNLNVTGILTANLNIGTNFASLNVAGNIVSNNLVVNSNTQLNNLIVPNLVINDPSNVNDSFSISSSAGYFRIINNNGAQPLTLGQAGDLYTGTTFSNGTYATFININGNTISNNLTVNGNTQLNNLNVTGTVVGNFGSNFTTINAGKIGITSVGLSNASAGTSLIGALGNTVVSTTAVTANSLIFTTYNCVGSVLYPSNPLRISAINAGSNFTVYGDQFNFAWFIVN